MGVAQPGTLGSMCQQDMSTITYHVDTIRAALRRVTALMGAETWTGGPADRWAGEFHGRMNAMSRLFDSYPAEQRRLVAAAHRKQETLNRQQR